jgi:hypothetical protein
LGESRSGNAGVRVPVAVSNRSRLRGASRRFRRGRQGGRQSLLWAIAEAPTDGLRTAAETIAASLFADPLTRDQRRALDLIATGFATAGDWPIFDYLEAEFDREDVDAWTVLESFPRVSGHGEYCAVWWPRRPGQKPAPPDQIALTILGLCRSHWAAAPPILFGFLSFLETIAKSRRETPSSPTQPRQPAITAASWFVTSFAETPQLPPLPLRFLYDLMAHEPATWLGGSSITGSGDKLAARDSAGRAAIRRSHRARGVHQENRRDGLSASPAVPMVAPSPLDLVAALDYLDTVWRLADGSHLFELHGAQRTAQLAFAAATENEFQSKLTGLAEILRSVKLSATSKGERDKPLKPLGDHLVSLLPGSESRIRSAVDALHTVIDLRNAGQHSGAASKGAAAFVALGIGFPPRSWQEAWTITSGRTIEALDAIREELATLTP